METKDLILKQGSPADGAELYRSLWSRKEVFRCLFSRPSPTLDSGMERTARYAQMQRETGTEYFIYEKASGYAIGIAGLKALAPGEYTVTDIAIGPDYWGRGYGKQVLAALVSQAFGSLGARKLFCDCFRENTAWKKLALSCGFAYSHSQAAELKKDGAEVILDYYCLSAEDRLS